MRTEVKAAVGTNAWGDALYGKMLRGSYVEENVIREAVQIAIDEDIAMFDTARDYGLEKGSPWWDYLFPDFSPYSSMCQEECRILTPNPLKK